MSECDGKWFTLCSLYIYNYIYVGLYEYFSNHFKVIKKSTAHMYSNYAPGVCCGRYEDIIQQVLKRQV